MYSCMLWAITAIGVSSASGLCTHSPSCATGTGAAQCDCAARHPPPPQRPGQQAAHARPACQHGRAWHEALALQAPSRCPPQSRTRTKPSAVLRRAGALPLVLTWAPMASCPGSALAIPSSEPSGPALQRHAHAVHHSVNGVTDNCPTWLSPGQDP